MKSAKKAWKTRKEQRQIFKSVLSNLVRDKMMKMKAKDALDIFVYAQNK